MRFIACAVTFLLVVVASGCTASYQQKTVILPSTKLARGHSVVIATPANGFYESEEYEASGKMTAAATKAAFARFTSIARVSPDCADYACLKSAGGYDYGYAIIPEILNWEERATEWSGLPDKIEIKISVYDWKTDKELASTVVSGKSKWATFGGDHPQDLLDDPLNQYVETLY